MMRARSTLAALAIVAGIAGVSVGVASMAALVAERTEHRVTWSLMSEDIDGQVYVHDTGLTLDDCRASDRAPASHPVSWCERNDMKGLVVGHDCEGAGGPLYAVEETDLPKCAHVGRLI
jgi:hypothetical protein